ncbi:hypothetical protein T4E_10079 [Trichinella pseudospiralis]|uniref:Uncharacterized protein n=1 Tax=Trichinella pseudospiralis TaxID=6337 RepID=A0A0V0XSI8_TRIPS|nr:hypothetical protein T4E_10079 [Trichinella pseudospiralis]
MTPDEQTFKTPCYVKISLDISSKCAETAFALNMNSETRKKLIENSHEHQMLNSKMFPCQQAEC